MLISRTHEKPSVNAKNLFISVLHLHTCLPARGPLHKLFPLPKIPFFLPLPKELLLSFQRSALVLPSLGILP